MKLKTFITFITLATTLLCLISCQSDDTRDAADMIESYYDAYDEDLYDDIVEAVKDGNDKNTSNAPNDAEHINQIASVYGIWDRMDDRLLIGLGTDHNSGWVVTDLEGNILYDKYANTSIKSSPGMTPSFLYNGIVYFANRSYESICVDIDEDKVVDDPRSLGFSTVYVGDYVWKITNTSSLNSSEYTCTCYDSDGNILKEASFSDYRGIVAKISTTGAVIVQNGLYNKNYNEILTLVTPNISYNDKEKAMHNTLEQMIQNNFPFDDIITIKDSLVFYKNILDRLPTIYNLETRDLIELSSISELEGASSIQVSGTAEYCITMFVHSRNGTFCAILGYDGAVYCEPTSKFKFSPESYFSDGLCVAYSNSDKAYGYIDILGEWMLDPIYKEAGAFINSYAVVEFANGAHGVIDISGDIVFSSAPH